MHLQGQKNVTPVSSENSHGASTLFKIWYKTLAVGRWGHWGGMPRAWAPLTNSSLRDYFVPQRLGFPFCQTGPKTVPALTASWWGCYQHVESIQ